MGLRLSTTKQKILSIIIIGVLLTLFHIVIFRLFHNNVSIVDDKTPLAATVEAMFYVEDTTSGSVTCIGDGLIRSTRDITGDAAAAAAAIITAPDYSSHISDDLIINWSTIRLQNDEYKVYGTIGRASDPAPERISIRCFGAVGDGVTDDSAAFNTALKQLKSKAILYVPSGTYVIGNTVFVPSGTKIVGDPNNTIIIAKKGTSRGKTMFYVSNANNVSVENITVSGNSSENYENMNAVDGIHLLDLWNCSNVKISKCKFIDNIYCAIRDIGSSDVTVDNCYFKDVDCGFITLGNTDVSNINVTNNVFVGHQMSEPVSLFANASHNHVNIENNQLSNKTYGCGILVKGQKPNSDITINNNIIDACAVGINITNSSSIKILNNTVTNTTSGGGIKLINCVDAIYDNNYCSNVKQDGLLVQDCSNVTLTKVKTINCGAANDNYFNVRFAGTQNNNISFSDSTIEYNVKKKVDIGVCFACDTDIEMNNIEYNNASIWLTTKAKNINLSVPNSVKVKDSGALNTIKKY